MMPLAGERGPVRKLNGGARWKFGKFGCSFKRFLQLMSLRPLERCPAIRAPYAIAEVRLPALVETTFWTLVSPISPMSKSWTDLTQCESFRSRLPRSRAPAIAAMTSTARAAQTAANSIS